MKRILYICSEYSLGMMPFAANIVNIASESKELDVYVLTVSKGEVSYKNYIKDTLIKRHVDFVGSPANGIARLMEKLYDYRLFRAIKKIVDEEHIDYIHLLTADYTLNQLIPRLRKKAVVVYTVHDLISHETAKKRSFKGFFFDRYIHWGVKRNIHHADILVTCSKEQLHALEQAYPSKKVRFHRFPTLITNGITGGNALCPELSAVNKYILFFGYVDVYKGVELLYDAFLDHALFHTGYSLVIAGKGGWCFERRKDEKNVIRIDRYIADAEIKSLFKNAACVVYPYISATQSGVFTLAYKLGTPLLASDTPYFRDNIKDRVTGFLFKSRDKDDLANKMQELLFDTDTAQMKKNQATFYDEHYSAFRVMKEIEQLYT